MGSRLDVPARPAIVIAGAGFGGLGVAKALGDTPADISLIDRTNHYLFQPLLYQVATAKLSPADIAAPVRKLVKERKNVTVLMSEIEGVDVTKKLVSIRTPNDERMAIPFDYLVLATGARHSYFGRNDYAQYAPGLKKLVDASSIRGRILKAFETAETEPDANKRASLMTFILIGAGPTGVEMAGAIAELRRYTLRREFRRIDTRQARIILVEGGPRILQSFHESLAAKAHARLEKLGVEVWLNRRVEHVGPDHIVAGGQQVDAHNIVWTAGVEPSPAAKWLNCPADHAGRVQVNPDCSVPGHPNIFVVGDTASFETANGPLPGVAQVALQQGRYVARVIRSDIEGRREKRPFTYSDRGNMAVIGRNFAILERGRIRMAGYLAWFAWVFIHIAYLADHENRFAVFSKWAWSYFNQSRVSRLIIEPNPNSSVQ